MSASARGSWSRYRLCPHVKGIFVPQSVFGLDAGRNLDLLLHRITCRSHPPFCQLWVSHQAPRSDRLTRPIFVVALPDCTQADVHQMVIQLAGVERLERECPVGVLDEDVFASLAGVGRRVQTHAMAVVPVVVLADGVMVAGGAAPPEDL